MSNIFINFIEVIKQFFKSENVKKILKEILWTLLTELAKIIKQDKQNQRTDFV